MARRRRCDPGPGTLSGPLFLACALAALAFGACDPGPDGRDGPAPTVALGVPEIDPALALLPADRWNDFTVRRGATFRATVPARLADSVWIWLERRYDGPDTVPEALGGGLTLSADRRRVEDRYFDTADLQLLTAGRWLRLRSVRPAGGGEGGGRGTSSVQLGGRLAGTGTHPREIHFRVHVPRPGARRSFAHEVIGMVEENQRGAFRHALEALGAAPERTYNTLTLRSRQRRMALLEDGDRVASVTVSDVRAEKWWEDVSFSSVEVSPDGAALARADSAGKASIERVAASVEEDLRTAFPEVPATDASDYRSAFRALEGELLAFGLALRLDAPVEAALGALGLLLATAGVVVLRSR